MALFCSKCDHKTDLPSESRLDLTVLRGYELNLATMEPNELEEFQGFRVEDLCVWLVERGWRSGTGRDLRSGICWRHDALGRAIVLPTDARTSESRKWRWLFGVAKAVELPLQELLRQVNPRLRSGWPSEDDLKTYDRWLVRCPQLDGMMIVWGSDTMRERKRKVPNALVECWPVDAAGNKVRWKGVS